MAWPERELMGLAGLFISLAKTLIIPDERLIRD